MKLRYTPTSSKPELMKQSLERINHAVRRYGKNVYTNEIPPPFELVKGVSSEQLRSYLQSEEGSITESIHMHNIPFANINMYMHNQALSEQVVNSIVCESDCQDADNFTLGPVQFSNLEIFANKNANSSTKNLLAEFRKEDAARSKPSFGVKKRRSIGKFSSADRVNSQ